MSFGNWMFKRHGCFWTQESHALEHGTREGGPCLREEVRDAFPCQARIDKGCGLEWLGIGIKSLSLPAGK